jgi:hypothetical protein
MKVTTSDAHWDEGGQVTKIDRQTVKKSTFSPAVKTVKKFRVTVVTRPKKKKLQSSRHISRDA